MMTHDREVTAEELYSTGGPGPAELIKGRIVMMSPSGGVHGKVCARIVRQLANFVEDHQLGELATAEAGFLIARNPDTVRAPDVAFIATARIPSTGTPESYWPLAPDLAVEVVSPSDRWTEVEEKAISWLEAGAGLVWVIDPRSRTAYVHRKGTAVRRLEEGDPLEGEDVIPGFRARLGELLG